MKEIIEKLVKSVDELTKNQTKRDKIIATLHKKSVDMVGHIKWLQDKILELQKDKVDRHPF